jgi:hypothetical protein
MSISEVIYRQLGGSKFMAMVGTGAPIKSGLAFRIATRTKNGANHFTVVLASDDLYTLTFSKVPSPRLDPKTGEDGTMEIEVIHSVVLTLLRATFEDRTGLYCSL